MLSVSPARLDAEVVHLEGEYRQAVNRPCRRLGVELGVGLRGHILELHHVVVVDALHEVGAVLVGGVDAALELQGVDGVHVSGAHQVFEVPLHGVHPRLLPQQGLERAGAVRVVLPGIHRVCLMIFRDLSLKQAIHFHCFHIFCKRRFKDIIVSLA